MPEGDTVPEPAAEAPAPAPAAEEEIWEPPAAAPAGGEEIWNPPAAGKTDTGEIWTPPSGEDQPVFEDKGEKDVAAAEKQRFDMAAEYRSTRIIEEAIDPELGEPPTNLYYLNYYMGLTSTTSVLFETEKVIYANEPDSGWARVDWAKLLDTEARIDLELAGLWADDSSNGWRTAFTYGWPAGLNLDLAVRLQLSKVEDNWGYQVELEGLAFPTPHTGMWARGYYYWDQEEANRAQYGVGLAQYLGEGTALHLEAYLGDADALDAMDEVLEASSGSVRAELRHTLAEAGTMFRMAYLEYYDSWHHTGRAYTVRAEHPFSSGSYGLGYRYYMNQDGMRADTWLIEFAYQW